jgi:glycosyltransferase involved in cell wall biosynthesis
MINETVLCLIHSDCRHPILKKHAKHLDQSVNWDPELHVTKPLSSIFSKVIEFDVGKNYATMGVSKTNEMILQIVRSEHPKYVFWPTMSYEILESTFSAIRQDGSYVVGWFFDDECRFDEYSRWWIPFMDYMFTTDKIAVARYQESGAKAIHLVVTTDPDYLKPTLSTTSWDVSFVGSRSVADRDNLVELLSEDGIRLSTFGKGWPSGFVSNEEMFQIYSNSKINICFTKSYGAGTRNQLKNKIFDITMCGGFLLCEYVDGIEEFFDINREIACFHDFADALHKIRYFLENEHERQLIVQAGKERSVRDYSPRMLFGNAFKALELDTQIRTERTFSDRLPLDMPEQARMLPAQFHFRWAEILKTEGFEEWRWREELDLARTYLESAGGGNEKVVYSEILCDEIFGSDMPEFPHLYNTLKDKSVNFVRSMKAGTDTGLFRYAPSRLKSHIYASAYACMILSLYGELEGFTASDRRRWADYFDSFQSEDDGLFYDEVLRNELYDNTDWWGARHFALHVIPTYTALGCKPKYPFKFVLTYYDTQQLRNLLDSVDWESAIPHSNDIDNKIMNIGSALQYSRDFNTDGRASAAVSFLLGYLKEKINPSTGLWGRYDLNDPNEVSRMVQFGYHLLSLYFYDGCQVDSPEKIIDFALETQNSVGGFGVQLNSSACEDIDSVDLLIKLSGISGHRRAEVEQALHRALYWIVSNMNRDGGFVFRRNEPFHYGHNEMSSGTNESSLFATWFRTLAIANIVNKLAGCDLYTINHSPGLEFRYEYIKPDDTATLEGNDLRKVYDSSFYDEQKNDSLRSAKIIVPMLMDATGTTSVIDVGCGVGGWLWTFRAAGVTNIYGYDANELSPDSYFIDKNCIETGTDFTDKNFRIARKAELLICLEVAEHFPGKAADRFIHNLVSASPIVIFSAALPGQTGVNHINEQPPWYWREKFNMAGYFEIDFIRPQILRNANICWWYRQNITCFVRPDVLAVNPKLAALAKVHGQNSEQHKLTVVNEWVLRNILAGEHLTPHVTDVPKSRPILSVIIPTRNRASLLYNALESLTLQTYPADNFQVIVVDNGSSDETAEVCHHFQRRIPQLKRLYAPHPGLHIGRHEGLREATGEILVYADDDIEAQSTWLEGIAESFDNPEVALVGGKILPKFEFPPPEWVNDLVSRTDSGWSIGWYSILDFGDVPHEIGHEYIWGCNFAIRKEVLRQVAGFHPDAFPQEMIKYRGDGETAVTLAVRDMGFKAWYNPKAAVYHVVSAERLTEQYIYQRAYNQGISDSYATIRKHGSLSGLKSYALPMGTIQDVVNRGYADGFNFHHQEVKSDNTLLEWILKDDYMDGAEIAQ